MRIASITKGIVCAALLSVLSSSADVIQFGWKVEEPPLDGATRIIDWKGQYTNLTTGAYSASGSQGNFQGLTVAQGPHLDDPITSLSMAGSQCWAYHELTNGTFDSWAHAVWVKEGIDRIETNETVAFSFSKDVVLKSIGWQSWLGGTQAEISYAGRVETNTLITPNPYDLGDITLSQGDELVVRVLTGGARISGITVYTESVAPPVPPQAGTNVLFIAIDDLKPLLGCYGDTLVKSPRIDGLASNGVTFLNAHCQWAVCGPSRASLMTGLMPEEVGVLGFKKMRGLSESGSADGDVTRANVVTLQQHFRYNGYRTAATGKINDPRCVGSITNLATGKVLDDGRDVDDPPSWGDPVDPNSLPADFFTTSSYVKALGGWSPTGKPATGATNLPDSAFADGIVCDEGIALLNQLATGDTQFFLGVGFKKPHLAFYAPQDCWDRYNRDDVDIHPFQNHPTTAVSYTWNYASELESYDDFNPSIPGYINATNIPPAKQKELIHGYYACVSHIDDQVGRLLDALESTGLHSNTIVALWGDHGFHLGDHAEWGKHTNLEQATRVPMIIYSPSTGVAGATTDVPANFTDLYPTICDLVGIPVPEQPLNENEPPTAPASGLVMKGSSLVPVMQNPTNSIRTGALSIYRRSGALGYSYRTDQYRLTEWISTSSNKTLARELYDYDEDPMETLNLATQPSYSSVLYTLSHAMRDEPEAAGCPTLAASRPLTSPGTIICFR